jgi:polar amino acid transport system substrate-binding protein
MNRNLPLILCLLLFACTEQPEQKTRITEPTGTAIRPANEILLVADYWFPFNGEPGSDSPGFLVELVRESFAGTGLSVSYEVLPWARAIERVRSGDADGLIGAGPDETPDFIFPDEPIAYATHSFFVLQNSTWEYSGIEALKAIQLGVIQDYSYGSLRQNYIEAALLAGGSIQEVNGNRALLLNLRKLRAERIDALVAEVSVFGQLLNSQKLESSVRNAGLADREPIHIAFSPRRKEALHWAKLLAGGLARLEESGRRAELARRYQVCDTSHGASEGLGH